MNTPNINIDDGIVALVGALVVYLLIIFSAPLFAEYLRNANRGKKQ